MGLQSLIVFCYQMQDSGDVSLTLARACVNDFRHQRGSSMRLDQLDRMTEFAVEILSSGDRNQIVALVRRMAGKWPQVSALGICFAITSAAARLEAEFDDPATMRSAALGYKLAALVASDILALETMGGRQVIGNDLMSYWHRLDPFFLKL